MRDARYRCLNHNTYYMRDITAIYTIRYKKNHHAVISASALIFSNDHVHIKTYFLQYQMDEVCRYRFNCFFFFFFSNACTVTSRLK